MATKGQINVDFALRYVGAVGANRYVANVSRYSTIAYRDIVQYAARAAHVPESAVDVAMEALFDALSYFVLNGHNVKIDGIGTFAFGVNAKAEINEEDAGADSVHRLKILYLPEMDLRREMNNVVITTSWSNPGNLEEDQGAVHLSVSSMRFGQSAASAKTIALYGVNYLMAGTNYLVLEGTALNKWLSIELTGWGQNPNDPDEPSMVMINLADTAPGVGSARVSHGFGKSTFKFNVPYNIYLSSIRILERNDDGTVTPYLVERYYSVPDSGFYAETAAELADIMSIDLNGITLSNNMTVLPNSNGQFLLTVSGPNARSGFASAVFTGATATASSSTMSKVIYRITPNEGVSSFTLRCAMHGAGEQTYTINLGNSSQQVVINSLSANGVSISNNGSSTIVEGESYNFTLTGQNLNLLNADNLVVPTGSSVRNFAKSANQITFQLVDATDGEIKVNYQGAVIFLVTVEAYVPETGSAVITTIGGVGNNGTYNARGLSGNSLVLPIVGTDLDQLTTGSFRFHNGSTFQLSEGTATARDLTIRGTLTTGQLLVMNGDTTIFKLNLDFGDEFVI